MLPVTACSSTQKDGYYIIESNLFSIFVVFDTVNSQFHCFSCKFILFPCLFRTFRHQEFKSKQNKSPRNPNTKSGTEN